MIVNISIEDLVPKFNNLDPLYEIVDNFPRVKFDIFIPINSNWMLKKWREKDSNWTNDILKHPKWCEKIIGLPSKNFEIALHGYCHHELDGREAPEFIKLDKSKAKKRLLRCERTFVKANIPFVRGFRPPKFRCSRGTIKALEELNYLFYAPHPRLVKEPSSLVIPQIYFNTQLNGTEEESPFSRDKYRLFRGHYGVATWPILKYYKHLIKFLKDLQQEKEVEFKFYTEIAEDMEVEKKLMFEGEVI